MRRSAGGDGVRAGELNESVAVVSVGVAGLAVCVARWALADVAPELGQPIAFRFRAWCR
ncbi:MAG: hypothetical protein RIT81_27070 [Deltaproteobacteria bacterium]